MLRKLLKHNLIDFYKFLIVFYTLSIIGAILTRLIGLIDNSLIFDIIWNILSGFTISMMASMLINNIMRSWVRFRDNFYKDESYLTHTLPVKRSTIFLSRFLSTIVTLFTSFSVILLTIFIAYYSKENLEFLKNILDFLSNMFNTSLIVFILSIFILLFLELLLLVNVGYTGIILGNKMNDKKLLFSIIYSFITYMVYQLILLLVLFVIALFNKDIMEIFISSTITDFNIIKYIVVLSIILYGSLTGLNYVICNKLLEKGINVD